MEKFLQKILRWFGRIIIRSKLWCLSGLDTVRPKAPFTPSASTRVNASNQTDVKDSERSRRTRGVASRRVEIKLICLIFGSVDVRQRHETRSVWTGLECYSVSPDVGLQLSTSIRAPTHRVPPNCGCGLLHDLDRHWHMSLWPWHGSHADQSDHPPSTDTTHKGRRYTTASVGYWPRCRPTNQLCTNSNTL